MASWLDRQMSSHRVQLGVVAVLSSVVVAGLIFGVQATRRHEAVEDLKASIPSLDGSHHPRKVSWGLEILQRLMLIGESEAHGMGWCFASAPKYHRR